MCSNGMILQYIQTLLLFQEFNNKIIRVSKIICKVIIKGNEPQMDPELIQLQIQRCIGLLRTNCLDFDSRKGRIFYPFFSFLSHSCVNNAKHVENPKSSDKKIR